MTDVLGRAGRLQAEVDALGAGSPLAGITDALDEVGAPTESGGFWLAPAGRIRALNFRLITAQNRERSRYHATRDALNDALEYLRSRGQDDTGQEVIKRCQIILDGVRESA